MGFCPVLRYPQWFPVAGSVVGLLRSKHFLSEHSFKPRIGHKEPGFTRPIFAQNDVFPTFLTYNVHVPERVFLSIPANLLCEWNLSHFAEAEQNGCR